MLRRLSVQKGGGVLSVFLFLQHQLFCLFPDGRLNGCGVVFPRLLYAFFQGRPGFFGRKWKTFLKNRRGKYLQGRKNVV